MPWSEMPVTERTNSARELARRLGVNHTSILKAERAGRISRNADGAWDVARARQDMQATATPGRSPLAAPAQTSAIERLALARLALGVESQRVALDQDKGRLMDIAAANHRIDEVAAGMRDAVLNWPARVSGQIAAEIGRDPHLVQTILQERMNALLLEVAEMLDPPAQ